MILDVAVKPAQKVLNRVFGATDKKKYLKEKHYQILSGMNSGTLAVYLID